jgi:hypothetical protein
VARAAREDGTARCAGGEGETPRAQRWEGAEKEKRQTAQSVCKGKRLRKRRRETRLGGVLTARRCRRWHGVARAGGECTAVTRPGQKKNEESMTNTTIKITICDSTSLERSLVTSARRAGMRSLKKSKVYRGKIADMRPKATRARLRRSTVCPVKRGRGAKRKKTGKNKKVCRRAPTKSRAAQCGSPEPDSLLIHSQHDASGVPSAAAVYRR